MKWCVDDNFLHLSSTRLKERKKRGKLKKVFTDIDVRNSLQLARGSPYLIFFSFSTADEPSFFMGTGRPNKVFLRFHF
jgi:hypothetical protein